MNMSMKNVLQLGAALALLAVVATGCSDTTTTPKNTDPYPNSRLLISGATLATNLTAANQVIVDTRSATAFAAGHLPNAVSLPITPGSGLFDKGGAGLDATDLKTPPELAAVFGAAGIAANTTIVIYGSDIDWLVGRMFWMLEYIGATDVRLLDGGWAKWTADGRATSMDVITPAARTFVPTVVEDRLVTKARILADHDDTAHYVVVDARNASDYLASHIPHAVNILLEQFLNTDMTMKTAVEIQDVLTTRGVTKDKVVYTHCYIGYRSSQEYFVLRLMGYTVAQYDGSWTEWNADPNTPKES